MPVVPAQLSYDIHLFTDRHGNRCVSVTLPNGKRTKRRVLSKYHERVLLELIQMVKMYENLKMPEPPETKPTATRRGVYAHEEEPVPTLRPPKTETVCTTARDSEADKEVL